MFLSITGWKQTSLFLTSLTVPSLKTCWTATHPRSSTTTTIHALWIAQSCLAVLPHIAFRTLANLLIVAPATIGTFLVTLWIWVFNKGYTMYRIDLSYIENLRIYVTVFLLVLACNEVIMLVPASNKKCEIMQSALNKVHVYKIIKKSVLSSNTGSSRNREAY